MSHLLGIPHTVLHNSGLIFPPVFSKLGDYKEAHEQKGMAIQVYCSSYLVNGNTSVL